MRLAQTGKGRPVRIPFSKKKRGVPCQRKIGRLQAVADFSLPKQATPMGGETPSRRSAATPKT